MSAQEETVETLLGLVRSTHSPWVLMKDSSAEDRFLRELAIQHPLMIKDAFFYSYFRSLRVVDKGVSAELSSGRAGEGSLGSWSWGTLSIRTLRGQQEGLGDLACSTLSL